MRYLRRSIALLLLVWYLPACTTYTELAPEQTIHGREQVRVTVVAADGDEATLKLLKPWARENRVGGVLCQKDRSHTSVTGTRCENWSTPTNSVVKIETIDPPSQETTTLLVVATLAAAVGVAFLVFGVPESVGSDDDECVPPPGRLFCDIDILDVFD